MSTEEPTLESIDLFEVIELREWEVAQVQGGESLLTTLYVCLSAGVAGSAALVCAAATAGALVGSLCTSDARSYWWGM